MEGREKEKKRVEKGRGSVGDASNTEMCIARAKE